MINIKWTYPVSLAEAASLLEEKNVVPHGGGTHLSGRDLSRVEGIMCLKKLGLDYVKKENDTIEIGAMTSYADLVAGLSKISPDHILVKALKNAANTPCRNRITIGGSVAFVPMWSDLIGPLLALDASLVLVGKQSGEFKVSEYLEKKELQDQTLISAIKINNTAHRSFHYRDVKTTNDMPLFTITVLLKLDSKKISEAKAYIVGTKERISRLAEVEAYLQGKDKSDIKAGAIEDRVNVSIVGSRITDPEYMGYKAKIETARAIFSALEND